MNNRVRAIGVACVLVVAGAAAVYLVLAAGRDGTASVPVAVRPIQFDGEAAFAMLERICQLGPRPSGSEGMQRQQQLLTEYFQSLGATVQRQEFVVRHPELGTPVTMANLIVIWHPDRTERVLLCAHYDTRPYPDQDPDPRRRRGRFIGANDGASGVALLCQLGRHMPQLSGRYGVDFVLFDGEEFVFDRGRDEYFLGSTHFARQYASDPPAWRYRHGVLLDMIGDRDLNLYLEKNSLRYARSLTLEIWQTAQRLGVREFIPRPRHEVRDDHLPLNQIARIPTCNIIDFDYPRPGSRVSYWHTEADTPDKCSPESLAKVGWVLWNWLESLE